MKSYWTYLLFLLGWVTNSSAQNEPARIQGTVSFVSSRNVYVKFATTEGISINDTLFLDNNGALRPALQVENKSSTSTVCKPLTEQTFSIGTPIWALVQIAAQPQIPTPTTPPVERPVAEPTGPTTNNVLTPSEDAGPAPVSRVISKVSARLSVASYSNFADFKDLHRMRYAWNLSGQNIGGSKFSIENYITYRHTLNEPGSPQNSLAQALKVYAFSVRYDIDSTTSLSLGRRINPRMSNIGAIDGLQAEKRMGRMLLGAVVGSRPDFVNYGLNLNLLEAGAYLGWGSKQGGRYHQSTLGFMEQLNGFRADRRFLYLQHSSRPIGQLSIFTSMEADLFENINEVKKNVLRLTNVFASLRYRFSKKLELSLSYDARRNIIYYETYKNILDQLVEDESRQGVRVGISSQPFKTLSVGFNAGYRFQQSNINSSANYNAYINLSKIGSLPIRTSLTANYLKTNYLESRIVGVRSSMRVLKNKAEIEVSYRNAHLRLGTLATQRQQNILGLSISANLMQHLSLSLFYEGTLDEPSQTVHRFNTRFMYRF